MNQLWLGLLGGFLGAVLGVLGTEIVKFFLEPGKRLEAARDSILSDMLQEIDRVRTNGANYWNGCFECNTPEINFVEQDIKAGLLGLIRDSRELFQRDDMARASCEGEIRALRMLITGGSFGDGQKLNEPSTALEIKTKSNDLKRNLRTRRDKLKRRFF